MCVKFCVKNKAGSQKIASNFRGYFFAAPCTDKLTVTSTSPTVSCTVLRTRTYSLYYTCGYWHNLHGAHKQLLHSLGLQARVATVFLFLDAKRFSFYHNRYVPTRRIGDSPLWLRSPNYGDQPDHRPRP